MRLARILSAFLLAFALTLPTLVSAAELDTTAEAPAETTAPVDAAEPEEELLDCTPPEITHSKTAAVYCVEEDLLVYEKNVESQIYPSSTVKLMTAIIAVEELGHDLDREISTPVEAILNLQGNRIGLKRDEVLTVRELLYALICGCANDAANVLAIEIAGSIDEFVKLMNKRAEQLGAVNTNYTNPTGIHHPAMVTTGRDTMLIAAQAARSELILEMSSVEYYVIQATNKSGARTVYNKNCYYATNLEYLYIWKVPRGLNAGYTEEGGYCVATTAAADGLTYVVITMGADRDEKYIYSYTEAADLIKWALRSFSYRSVLTTSDMICEIPVKLASKVDYVSLFPSEPIELYLQNDVDLENDVRLTWALTDEYVYAPVDEGQACGTLTVTLSEDGKERLLGKYELVTRNSVSRNNLLYVFDLIGDLAETKWVKTAIIVVVLCVVAYIAATVWLAYRARVMRERMRSRLESRRNPPRKPSQKPPRQN